MSPESFGPYRVVRELGRGGMGVVYEVSHPELPGRRLALKTLLTTSLDPADVFRFQREARLLAQIDHPHVVRVHQLGQQHDTLFVVLDFVDGQPLDEVLRRGPLPPQRAAQLLIQLAEGVQTLHDAGIVHRDLKPQNVVLRADGTPVLLDFGLAREVDGQSLTQEGAVLGTPQFMSPEQARGGDQRKLPTVDVYGLGAILYACVSGRPPFEGGSMVSILYDVTSSAPPPLTEVPRPIAEVCFKALSKEPHARYASPRHLAHALQDALTQPAPTRKLPLGWMAAGLMLLGAASWYGGEATPAASEVAVDAPPEVPAPPPPPPVVSEPSWDWLDEAPSEPSRWLGFCSARAALAAGRTPAARAARARLRDEPLLRFETPGLRGLSRRSRALTEGQARWLADDRLLVFSDFSHDVPGVALIELGSGSFQPRQRWTSWGDNAGSGAAIRALCVAPDRSHFLFVADKGALHRVDLDDLDARATTAPRPGFQPLPNTAPGVWLQPEPGPDGSNPQTPNWALDVDSVGRVVLAPDDSQFWLGSADAGADFRQVDTHAPVRDLCFAEQDRSLAVVVSRSWDRSMATHHTQNAQLLVYDLERLDVAPRTAGHSEFRKVVFHPGTRTLFTGSEMSLLARWQLPDLQPQDLTLPSMPVTETLSEISALFVHDNLLFSSNHPLQDQGRTFSVLVWDVTRSLPPEPRFAPRNWVRSIDVSPDGTLVAFGLNRGWVEVWLVP